MRNVLIFGIILVLVLVFITAGCVKETPEENNSAENRWNGTWASEQYILFILQNGSEITGSYEPHDIESRDPGLLQGILSEDKEIFSGIWTESGPVTLVISDDGMSYFGTGGTRPGKITEQSYTYTSNGTRVGPLSDPDNAWSGTWKSGKTVQTMIQNGTSVRSTYQQVSTEEDEPGLFEGTVSGDGKTLTGKWMESGNFSFILSEDGSFWNGTYSVELDESAETSFWNATKLQ